MKKILSIIMALMMCVTFAACSGGASEGGESGASEEDSYGYAVEDMEVGSNIGSFVSEDLDGNEVTDAIFAEADVTILNVWATFCGPCIEEMPDLQALSEELPDNAQVIGIVIDAPTAGTTSGSSVDVWGGASENIELAKQIYGETGVKYVNILASESVSQIFENVEAVPTTFILDSNGNTVCKPIVGADVESYRQAVEDYLGSL